MINSEIAHRKLRASGRTSLEQFRVDASLLLKYVKLLTDADDKQSN